MHTKYKNHIILNVFCITITCIFLLHDDIDGSALFHNFYDLTTTHIELLAHSPLTDDVQNYDALFSSTPDNESFAYPVEYTPIHGFRPFLSMYLLVDQSFIGQQISSPIYQVISILHKQHTWHQSSDDEPLPDNTPIYVKQLV